MNGLPVYPVPGAAGYEEVTASTSTGAPLVGKSNKQAASVCNTSPSERVYYKLNGEDFSGAEKGGVILPGESLFLWNHEALELLRLKADSAIVCAIHYYQCSPTPTPAV